MTCSTSQLCKKKKEYLTGKRLEEMADSADLDEKAYSELFHLNL